MSVGGCAGLFARWFVIGLAIGVGLAGAPAAAEYEAKGRRDPFVPLLTGDGRRIHPPGLDGDEFEAASGNFRLEGIVYDPQRQSYAIVNDQVVLEGDEVNGAKVLKIEPTSVIILVEGERRALAIRPSKEETIQP